MFIYITHSEAIDVCDKLGNPKMLFQVKTMQDRASDFLLARSTYYVCRVEFGAPGTAQEQTAQSFVPLLKNPSVALTEALRLCGQHPHRKLLRSLKTPEGKKGPGTETLPAAARTQGVGKAVGRSTSRPREEQHGPPRKTPLPPRGRQQPRPR
ncbi:uncharacterized protein CXorf65 homolog isoform X2 [Gallus gallus]|uniref:uncharacterized protein CXorf65 homolog isoform X2 n=1 Tax=Gallus gallus TaxID=9031 RepID=UPI00035074F7|nr:uncharacterized protein CXorf65 homolog isoform X2 [Gallus gallus]XP_040555966.1 uncharacterized protein CXorf65 homolog isoform X2 [Gallus gallus]